MSKIKILLVVVILLLSFVLRLHNFEKYPQRGATSDEYTYAFLGISLWQTRVPISWSFFPDYKHRQDITIRGIFFPIVYPYFDHSPLYGLVSGGWLLLHGQNTFEKADLSTIRLVPIFLSGISSVLVFLLALHLFDYQTGIWALLIQVTTTVFVINERVGLAESLLTTLFLMSLLIFLKFKKNITFKKVVILGVLSGLSFWTKELGIIVFLTLLYLFVNEGIKKKLVSTFCAVFLLFIFLYFGYGYYYDFALFLKILSAQGSRGIGPDSILMLLKPIIINKPFYDGWYFFGFLSLVFCTSDFKKYKLILVPSLLYFLLLVFSLTKHGESGWYLIPLFPFLSIAMAGALLESLKKQNWYIFIFLLFVGLFDLKNLYEVMFGLTSGQFRVFILLFFVPLLFLFILNKKMYAKLGALWFYLLILANIIITYSYIHPA